MLFSMKINSIASRQFYPVLLPHRTKIQNLPKPEFYEWNKFKDEKQKGSHWVTNFLAVAHRKNVTLKEIKCKLKWKVINNMREDQKFNRERHRILGPDLAAAHFITFRGGKVKFTNNDKWITKADIESKEIPNSYNPVFRISAIDASDTKLCYEGFGNLIHLFFIKELSLRNCPFVNDHALSRLQIMQHSLEKLDISGCSNVSERGLCTLHVLKQLKTLIINDTPMISHRELTCLLLQDVLPNLKEIEGVDFDNPALHRRLQKYL